MSKVIWIDLWTTNSVAAYLLWDKPEVIPNAEWDRITPSVVYIKWDQLLVWKLAKRKALLEPKNVIYEVKRFIWRKFSEVQDEIKNIPYEVKEWPDGGVLIVVDGKEYKPEQISAFILKKIKEDAEKYLGEKIDRAVITVPAYFNDSQRQATKAAWEIAWFKVERIINEPTAAALAYGLWKNKDEKVAVFDLWGWTFDITIMEIWSEWTFQVLATNWDTHLGWADFDKRIIEWLIERFKEKEWIDLSKDPMALQRLKEEAENAKKQLSQVEEVEINIPFIITWPDGQPRHLQEKLTRAQFERLIEDLVERTVKPTMDALKDAWLTPQDINEVILVWGSTRVPLVRKKVAEIFGREPKMTVNPDEAVALWAAIQWGIIQGQVTDILLLDVTPLSLWVEVEGWLVDVVIPRNTTIPVRKTKIYTTAVDNQPAVTIHVVQWERPMARDNKSLWMFNLEWIPPMPRWVPQIEVTFDIDANGILHVSAREKSTWKEQKVTIQWATNLSEEEIKRMQEEAEKFATLDRKRKEVAEKRNQLDQIVYWIEKLIKENESKLAEQDKNEILPLLEDAKKLIDQYKDVSWIWDENQLDEIKNKFEEKIKELQSKSVNLYQKLGWNNQNPSQN
jgi:molecular chaperone DnaK